MPEYLIGYDIANPKRLMKIHKVMCGYALPLQLSVFLFEGTEPRLRACLEVLQSMICVQDDDIRCYRLTQGYRRYVLGQKAFTDGQFVLDD